MEDILRYGDDRVDERVVLGTALSAALDLFQDVIERLADIGEGFECRWAVLG